MSKLSLNWATKDNGDWYELNSYDFSKIDTVGVYHIWCGGEQPYSVRPGQGKIGPRIEAHKGDLKIMSHERSGTLYVTWAEVPKQYLDQVERYLADQFGPVEGNRFPDVVPLEVNLPGQ